MQPEITEITANHQRPLNPKNLRHVMPWFQVNAIALEINELNAVMSKDHVRYVAEAMAEVCSKWCLTFNREEFLEKCGVR
jgi:hypothetical protein